jgi:hypothetical protein
MSEAFTAKTTYHNGTQIAPSDVATLLNQAKEQSRALTTDLVKEAKDLAARAAAIAHLGNLPPGVSTGLNEINKLLTSETLKIDQQLSKNQGPAVTTPSALAA